MCLASLTHQAEPSKKVIEGKPKAKLSFCTLHIILLSLDWDGCDEGCFVEMCYPVCPVS